MRREGIGCLLKMSLVSVLLENSPGRVSTSRDFFPLFPSSRAGIRKRSYHPNINSWKNGGEEGGRSTRRRWGCAIGRNRSRNTRISFRNLEGVCVCVHGAVRLENMHLHGASASLHAPASSLTLQEFLLAWKIPLPNFPPPIGRKQFDPTHAGGPYAVSLQGTRKRNLSPPNLFLPYFPPPSLLLLRSRMISCGVEYWSVESWIACLGRMEVRSIFVSSGKRYAGNIVVLIYRRETILGGSGA